MLITSATFVKGVVKEDEILEDGTPQVAFIGRSNVGKSSIINTLANRKELARTSSFPGRTQEINLYLINESFLLVDLPGYGFAEASHKDRARLKDLINWYLFNAPYSQGLIVLIIDAKVGPTQTDLEILQSLEQHEKEILIVANKIDKIKNADVKNQLIKIQGSLGVHRVLPYSAKKKIGVVELTEAILQSVK